jgi:hypothetical protein
MLVFLARGFVGPLPLLRSVASLILGTAAMFYTSWQLSTLTLGLLPVTLIAVR